MGWGLNLYDPVKILIKKVCNVMYIRFYYNGWHYWAFLPGKTIMVTEGEDYRTLGTKKIHLGSGQLTRGQCAALRNIMFAKDAQLYTIAGWMNIRVEPGSINVYDNQLNGEEFEFIAIIGSKDVSYSTGYSPIGYTPPESGQAGEDQVFLSDKYSMHFAYNEDGPGVADIATLLILPDQIIGEDNTIDWATVVILQTDNLVKVYPNSENGSTERSGTVTLHCPGALNIAINVIQDAAPPDSISLDITLMHFDYVETCCDVCQIVVTSSGPWTAAWVFGGLWFDSDKFAGGSGETCTIVTVGENWDAFDYGDTLRFVTGSASVDCEMIQYKFGDFCP